MKRIPYTLIEFAALKAFIVSGTIIAFMAAPFYGTIVVLTNKFKRLEFICEQLLKRIEKLERMSLNKETACPMDGTSSSSL